MSKALSQRAFYARFGFRVKITDVSLTFLFVFVSFRLLIVNRYVSDCRALMFKVSGHPKRGVKVAGGRTSCHD